VFARVATLDKLGIFLTEIHKLYCLRDFLPEELFQHSGEKYFPFAFSQEGELCDRLDHHVNVAIV
jgi:hypothetical protein